MTYKKGSCAEFGPVNVFQFKSDSVKPFSNNNNNNNNNNCLSLLPNYGFIGLL